MKSGRLTWPKPRPLPTPTPASLRAAADPVRPWPDPVDAEDTRQRMLAQSALAGIRYRDGSTQPDTLTTAQARDVLAWHNRSHR